MHEKIGQFALFTYTVHGRGSIIDALNRAWGCFRLVPSKLSFLISCSCTESYFLNFLFFEIEKRELLKVVNGVVEARWSGAEHGEKRSLYIYMCVCVYIHLSLSHLLPV